MWEELTSSSWPLGWSLAVFCLAGAVTVAGSVRLVRLGDALASRTGWGEALFGAVFFGLVTSLSGLVMTATAAAADQPQIAYSNAVGGIVAQTTAVVVADAFHRGTNLEHAAASLSNLLFGCLLVGLLGLGLLASFTPDLTVATVHPVSAVMVACYVFGLWLVRSNADTPMWEPVHTRSTQDESDRDQEDALPGTSMASMWGQFLAVGGVVAASGWLVANAGSSLVEVSGLRAGFVGGVLMGLVNGLPEMITAVIAVRRGAVTLAVAAILGGNALDALNLVLGDVVYQGGSLYHAAGPDELFVTAAGLVMTAIVMAGLLVRQTRGLGRLGFEGPTLLLAYVATVAVLIT